MGALRQARSFNTDGSNSQSAGTYIPSMSQGLPTLIVMIVVLFIIMAFCFWGAPAVRAFCKRKICCCCKMDEPNIESEFPESESTTPTIILLPYGRMLVVDRTVFAQLRATHTGIDFMEISANLIRAQRIQTASVNNTNYSNSINKRFSTNASSEFLPPAYEDIYDRKNCDLPPSYSEISIMTEKLNRSGNFQTVIDLSNSVNNINRLRTFPSVPSIPNELKSKRRLLLSIRRKYSSLDTINTGPVVQNYIANDVNVTVSNEESENGQHLRESSV